MAPQSSLRASDADREAVAERLRHAAVEGRLEPTELEDRLHAALRARTYGDLGRLVADLPARPVPWTVNAWPAARTALAVAMRIAVILAVVSVVLVAAVAMAAWWMLWVVVWFVACGRRSCARLDARRGPRVREVQPGRLAGLR
jgi:hypothetical protein